MADFIGDFPVLENPDHPALDPNPEVGYPAGQALAEMIRREGGLGLIYPSVRATGDCLVCFEASAVRNVRPGASWRLIWRGSPHYDLEAISP